MEKTKIFIASSAKEFKTDLMEIENFFRRLNDFYLDKDLFFSLNTYEGVNDAVGRDHFKRELINSDIVFFLFYKKISTETMEAFDIALDSFKKSDKPKAVTYFRIADAQSQTDDITRLMQRIDQEYGYYNTYGHSDTLLLGMLMQIKLMGLNGVDIRLENGKVLQGATELLSLEHVEMVSGHEDLRRLKAELAELERHFLKAKTQFMENPDDNAAYEALGALSKRRNEITKETRDVETRLYRLIENMYEQVSRGELSKRQEECYWLIERGKYAEAKTVLNYNEIISDSRHNLDLADKADRSAQIYVNELLQLKGMNETLADWPGVDACYREAVRLEERHNLPRKAMPAYAQFLYNQNRHAEGVMVAEQLRHYYQNPAVHVLDADKGRLYKLLGRIYQDTQRMAEAEEMFNAALEIFSKQSGQDAFVILPDWADSYNRLGDLLSETQKYNEAETMYKAALDILIKLAVQNPDVYEPHIASSYNNLGELYRETQRITEAEETHKIALEIEKRLAAGNPDAYALHLAKTYNKLGALYDETERFGEAEAMFKAALDIQTKPAEQNPDAYEPLLSDIYNNLGLSYMYTKRLTEAEDMHKRAIEIRRRLVGRNPEAFERKLANSYNSLGSVYYEMKQMQESEEMNKAALEIRKRLAARNPGAYDELVSDSYNNLGCIYEQTGRLTESESMYKAALEITQKLAARNPDASEMDLADIYLNIGNLNRTATRVAEAEEAYRVAVRLYSKYMAVNPYCAKQAAETQEALESLYNLIPADEKGTPGLSSMMALFTPEEREIAILLTDGETQRDISRKLKLTAAEVSSKVNAIREKVISMGDPDPVMTAVIHRFRLSRREAHILRCLRQDMTNADIAAELFIAEETVRVHIHKLLKKLPVESRQGVAAWVKTFGES